MEESAVAVEINAFGDYEQYTIKNRQGAYAVVTSLGATVKSIVVPDRNGALGDVILGYDTPTEYLENDGYFGAFVGRYANRISGAHFELDGKHFRLTANEGGNTLHGGTGLSLRGFETADIGMDGVTFKITDPAGGDGFPGKLEISVRYEFNDANELSVSYTAVTDAPTPVNLTNHSYFNLAGSGDILSHRLMINADSYLPVDAELIPTGELRPVYGTRFDFKSARSIENGGYDHCFVLSGSPCAVLYEPECGRKLTVITDMPAVQFYAGGMIASRRGRDGAVYGANSGLCLETQLYPDSPNRPEFPNCILRPGEVFKTRTVYAFSAE